MFELARSKGKTFEEWLDMGDFKQYLLDTRHGDVPVYYHDGKAGGLVVLSSLFLPRQLFHNELVEELINWQQNPVESGWGYSNQFENGVKQPTRLNPPFSLARPEILQQAVPILTRRFNSLFKDSPIYYEVNPEILHVHDLHWSDEHHAYCTLDENGDIWEVVKVQQREHSDLVSFDDAVLYKHMILGDYLVLRFFDLDRWEGEMPHPHSDDYARMVFWHGQNIHARWTPVRRSDGSLGRVFLRGFQILLPPDDPAKRSEFLNDQPKQFCTFITLDWKYQQVVECSCDPIQLGNYFVESDDPFEISPAFFKQEVLKKYQTDAEKYTVKDRIIFCRSTWSLRYDFNNEEGQVHVYLKDLAGLPYSEQLYWKSYNEPPKAGISRRAYKTDFLAEWDDEPEPLRDLKGLLDQFPSAMEKGNSVQVWQPPTGADLHLADQVHYPTGNVRQEWETEITELDKLVVEGLNLKYFRRLADSIGIRNEQLGSITLLRELLIAKTIALDIVAKIVNPLLELQEFRSKFGSHRAGTEADQIAKELRHKYGSLANHFRDIVALIYEGLSILADMIQKGYLNLA